MTVNEINVKEICDVDIRICFTAECLNIRNKLSELFIILFYTEGWYSELSCSKHKLL